MMTPDKPVELAPGIFRMTGRLGARVVHTYLVRGSEGALLVDCGDFGHPESLLEPALDTAGLLLADLKYVVVTHSDADHVGGLGEVARMAPHARVVAHRLEAPDVENVELLLRHRYLYAQPHGVDAPRDRVDEIRRRYTPTGVDVYVDSRLDLRLGPERRVQLRHAPGHSAGHLVVFDPTTRTAMLGDALLSGGVPAADGSPALPPPYHDVDAYLRTSQVVADWSPERILTAHFPVCEGAEAARAFVADSRRFVRRLEEALRRILRDQPAADLPWLCDALAAELGTWPRASWRHLAAPILAHMKAGARAFE